MQCKENYDYSGTDGLFVNTMFYNVCPSMDISESFHIEIFSSSDSAVYSQMTRFTKYTWCSYSCIPK